jgi:hypothetical protein
MDDLQAVTSGRKRSWKKNLTLIAERMAALYRQE